MEYINQLAASGIVNGKADKIYSPGDNVTRFEYVTMLARAFNIQSGDGELPFSDVPEGHWAYDAVSGAYSLGIINGVSENMFGGNSFITREQMAAIVYRYLELLPADENTITIYNDDDKISDWAKDAVYRLQALGWMNGKDNNKFDPSGLASRAETAALICRSMPETDDNEGRILGEEEMNLLICLGAKAEKKLSDALNIGDFAKLLAASIYDEEDYLPSGKDVSNDKVIEYSVKALQMNGLLNDDADAQDNLDLNTVLKALVSMLGYGQLGLQKSYETQAGELGILKGVYPKNVKSVTMAEAVTMIYNSLFINLMEVTDVNKTSFEQTISDYNTILTKNRDIYRYKGFIYDNGITNVNGKTRISKNYIKIGDAVMNVGKTNISDYLLEKEDYYEIN